MGGCRQVAAVTRQPVDSGDKIGGEADAPFTDREPLLVDLTVATDDVKIATGNARLVNGPVRVNPLFEAAAAAATTAGFPGGIDRFRNVCLAVHDEAS